MARRLRLVRKQLATVRLPPFDVFRLRVEASDPTASGADPMVFLYNRRPVNPYDGTAAADFVAVCSPTDLAEYPAGVPDRLTTFPFFRLDYVELDFRAARQAEACWLTIVAEVDNLLRALDRMDRMEVVDTVWVGAPFEGGVSSSLSDFFPAY